MPDLVDHVNVAEEQTIIYHLVKLGPSTMMSFVPPDPFKDCDGFVMAESVQRLAIHCQNLVAFLKHIDGLSISLETTRFCTHPR